MVVPMVIVGQLLFDFWFLLAADFQLELMREVTFGADVGKQMRDITEGWVLWANEAFESY
jgi:hypothetical protein